MILEVCCNSYQSVKNAQQAGAQRIEFCSELGVGGITPSYGLLKTISEVMTIPVFVLIRPRSGNFTYSDVEFNIMKQNIELCKTLGFAGIVSGILHDDNTINSKQTRELLQLAKPLSFTFHRAFDTVPNPVKALQQLADMGVDRVLTSGQQSTAEQGIALLQQLNTQSNQKITILPGGGINPDNAKLFKDSGFTEIHASASKPIDKLNKMDYFGKSIQTVSDVGIIQSILKQIT